jgi:hypothetical protein
MNRERYIELNSTGQDLAPEEWDQGWHWCVEWDGLLVGPNSEEALVCSCNHPVIEAWKVSPEGQEMMRQLEIRSEKMDEEMLKKDPLEFFKDLGNAEHG